MRYVLEHAPESEQHHVRELLIQEGRIESYLRRKAAPDAPCRRHKSDAVEVNCQTSFVLYLCTPTPHGSPDQTRADPLESQPEVNGLLVDLPDQ